MRPWICAVIALSVLGACDGGAGLATGTTAPAVNPRGAGASGLEAGHRLMAAGEHELALRSYLRAASEEGANADVLSAIGSANLKLGRLGQSEAILRRALDLDPTFVPALNNLGVVLMEKGETGEARRVFEQAFAFDSGATDSIRENLRLAIAQSEESVYSDPSEANGFSLVRQGGGQYLLLSDL